MATNLKFYTNGTNRFSIDTNGATKNEGTFNSVGLISQNGTTLDSKYQTKLTANENSPLYIDATTS